MQYNMYVVFYSSYLIKMASFVFEYSPNKLIEFLPVFFKKRRFSVLGTKNYLIEDLGVCAAHWLCFNEV